MQTVKLNKARLESLAAAADDDRAEYRVEGYPGTYLRVSKHRLALTSVRRVNGKQQRATVKLDPQRLPNLPTLKNMIADMWQQKADQAASVALSTTAKHMIANSNLAPGTVKNYHRAVSQIIDAFGDKFPSGAMDIQAIHRGVANRFGPVQANSAVKILRRVMRYAKALGHVVPEWPTESLRVVKVMVKETPRDRRLSAAQIPIVCNATLPEPWGRLLKFYLLTGFRQQEALTCWLEDGRLCANTKNGTIHRLPATPLMLSLWDGGFGVKGTKSLTKYIKAETGIHISPHDCRRTFASTATMAGLNQTVIAHLMNHRSSLANVTSDYQGRPEDPVMLEALKAIENIYVTLGVAF